MSRACREHELDALVAGELPVSEAERVRAHALGCAACAHALAWLQLERRWMTQRARRTPGRSGLSYAALEARLAAASASAQRPRPARERVAPQRRVHRHGGKLALSAAAAGVLMALSVAQMRLPPLPEEAWGREELCTLSSVACVDGSHEQVAALEAHFAACLIASPAR